MQIEDDLKNLEVYCKRQKCGDPVADNRGNVHYTKRRMNLVGTGSFMGTVTFACPVCGRERKFKKNALTGKITEV